MEKKKEIERKPFKQVSFIHIAPNMNNCIKCKGLSYQGEFGLSIQSNNCNASK